MVNNVIKICLKFNQIHQIWEYILQDKYYYMPADALVCSVSMTLTTKSDFYLRIYDLYLKNFFLSGKIPSDAHNKDINFF